MNMAEAILIIYGRRLREKLKKAGAITEDTAKNIEELNLSSREIRTLKRNVLIGKVKEITDKNGEKRYYVPSENEK
jgi:hypothetical protein